MGKKFISKVTIDTNIYKLFLFKVRSSRDLIV